MTAKASAILSVKVADTPGRGRLKARLTFEILGTRFKDLVVEFVVHSLSKGSTNDQQRQVEEE